MRRRRAPARDEFLVRAAASLRRGFRGTATNAIGATAAPAATATVILLSTAIGVVAGEVGPDGLEHDINIALDAEPCPDGSEIGLTRSEVMDHRGTVVEQQLDID
jgi:hypothetical protein